MELITFEQLPSAISKLYSKLEDIERLLQVKSDQNPQTDQWFDLDEFCIYHPDKPAKATVYGLVQRGLIPYHKGSKKLRFLKSEIDTWLKNSKIKSSVEMALETDTFLQKSKRRGSSLSLK